MKLSVTGRVVGHSLFYPNPKDEPELELMKISVMLSPGTKNADKHTKAVLVIEKDAAWEDFVIGRSVTVTVTDYQGDLFQPKPSDRGESPPADTKPAKGTKH